MKEFDFSFLPDKYQPPLRQISATRTVWEIRMRIGFLPIVRTDMGDLSLGQGAAENVFICGEKDIETVLLSISGQAIYRISEALCGGAVYTQSGIRIGVGGRGITAAGELRSVTEITSLCIRFPFFKEGNAQKLLPLLTENGAVCCTLVCAPPAGGKTTLLRDFAKTLSQQKKNVTVVDERMEIACGNALDCDVIRDIRKDKAILIALRSLSPDIIVCDELMGREESEALLRAANGGVTVFSSMHAKSYSSAVDALSSAAKAFERLVIITVGELSRIARVYNREGFLLGECVL